MHAPRILVALLVLPVAGCSGGGAAPAALPTAQIDGANALQTASVSVCTAFGLADTIGLVAAQLLILPPGEVTLYGPDSGQVVVTLDDRDGNGAVSTGDTIAMEFEAYGALSRVLDGAVVVDQIVMQGVIGEYQQYALDARLAFDGFQSARFAIVDELEGTLRLHRELRSVGTPISRLTSVRMDQPFQFGATTFAAGSQIGRNEYLTDNSLGWFFDARVDAPGIGGTADVTTAAPFVGYDFLPAPIGGRLETRGRTSSVAVEVKNVSGGVDVIVDRDADGRPEQHTASTWDALLGG